MPHGHWPMFARPSHVHVFQALLFAYSVNQHWLSRARGRLLSKGHSFRNGEPKYKSQIFPTTPPIGLKGYFKVRPTWTPVKPRDFLAVCPLGKLFNFTKLTFSFFKEDNKNNLTCMFWKLKEIFVSLAQFLSLSILLFSGAAVNT